MNRSSLRFVATLSFLILTLLYRNESFSAETENSPIIHIDQTTHTFPTVIVGKTLSHTFTVSNQGKADLNIKEVTHS